jgi:hypothetical protein
MVSHDVISFRKDYWMTSFPVEAQFFQWDGIEGHYRRTSQAIHSAQELHEFQMELNKREKSGEWTFVAYYESDASA